MLNGSVLTGNSSGETLFAGNLLVYPNPAGDACRLSAPGFNKAALQIDLFDCYGRQMNIPVLPVSGYGLYEIRLGKLQEGFYLIRVKDDRKTETVKLRVHGER